MKADQSTGFYAPLTVNGEPVWDLTDPLQPRLAVIVPGGRYRISQLAEGLWAILVKEADDLEEAA